ncbi:hypothetical protein [Desulfovibrio inopinatus]|uniref:hypothetical protein n=1 Tax=Desulfovibrio inopinatus TaxID=102109 RepID=UPI0004005E45|nr:hypothetical protein [Desulfovibrio inopinatus]
MSISPLTGISPTPSITNYQSTQETGTNYSADQQSMAINDAAQAQSSLVNNLDRQMVTLADAPIGNIINTTA